MAKNAQDVSINNLKTLMLLCIVFNHSSAALQYCNSEQIIFAHISSVLSGSLVYCLGAFFMISGYYTQMNVPGIQGYWEFLQKKGKTMLIPYILWNVIYIFCFLAGAFFVPVMRERCAELQLFNIWGIIDGLLGITHHPADGPLWYLRSLFCCIIFYPAVRYFCRHKSSFWLILAIAFTLGYFYPAMSLGIAEHFKPYIFPAFCIGVYLREQKISLHIFENYGAVAVLIFLLTYISLFFNNIWGIGWLIERRLIYLAVIPCWMFSGKFLLFSADGIFSRLFVAHSFFIYAAHALLGTAALRILAPLLPASPVKALLLEIGFLLSCGLGIVAAFILKTYFPVIYSLLTGGRSKAKIEEKS